MLTSITRSASARLGRAPVRAAAATVRARGFATGKDISFGVRSRAHTATRPAVDSLQ